MDELRRAGGSKSLRRAQRTLKRFTTEAQASRHFQAFISRNTKGGIRPVGHPRQVDTDSGYRLLYPIETDEKAEILYHPSSKKARSYQSTGMKSRFFTDFFAKKRLFPIFNYSADTAP